jgi:hypothetical protein
MATTNGWYRVKYKDYDGEDSTVKIPIAVLTAVNMDTQIAACAALQAALDDVLLGQEQSERIYNETVNAVSPPSNSAAQRELAWLILSHDGTTFARHKTSIPTPALAFLDANDRANAEIGDSGMVDALVSAFVAYFKSPAGNALVVDEITMKGRNL